MGTAAVFAIASDKPGRHYTHILGRTVDGFPANLRYCAAMFAETARAMQVLTDVRKNRWLAVKKVLDAIGESEKTCWFTDNQDNAAWVSYSAVYNPKTGRLCIYEGLFECQLDFIQMDVGKACTADGVGTEIGHMARMSPEEREKEIKREKRRKEKQRERVRRQALQKLTPIEREVLGVG